MPLPENEAFNVKFVRLVENHKCLYDASIPEYCSKEEQDKGWTDIAETCASTVGECKARWKNLRGGLTRYIKKLQMIQAQGTKSIKQFYLWDVMQFVTPFLQSRADMQSFRPSCFKYEDEESNEIGVDPSETSDSYETSIKLDVPENPEPTTSTKRDRKRARVTYAADDSFEKEISDFLATKTPLEKCENPDLEFFKSVLPDLSEFSASQKRRFKMGVLQLIEDISNEGTVSRPSSTFSITSSSTRWERESKS